MYYTEIIDFIAGTALITMGILLLIASIKHAKTKKLQ